MNQTRMRNIIEKRFFSLQSQNIYSGIKKLCAVVGSINVPFAFLKNSAKSLSYIWMLGHLIIMIEMDLILYGFCLPLFHQKDDTLWSHLAHWQTYQYSIDYRICSAIILYFCLGSLLICIRTTASILDWFGQLYAKANMKMMREREREWSYR